jgi:hypothetical protein
VTVSPLTFIILSAVLIPAFLAGEPSKELITEIKLFSSTAISTPIPT